MAVNPLPPQAYTKETLQRAYSWLLTQSASIKEMASSQDMLISLYLRAQRNGDASLETPSIQNFKQELKSLAGIMGDLQVPAPATAAPPQSTVNHNAQGPTAPAQGHHAMASSHSTTSGHSQSLHTSVSGFGSLDAGSIQAIAEVKQILNLSSDAEALRALIALGHRQFKKM